MVRLEFGKGGRQIFTALFDYYCHTNDSEDSANSSDSEQVILQFRRIARLWMLRQFIRVCCCNACCKKGSSANTILDQWLEATAVLPCWIFYVVGVAAGMLLMLLMLLRQVDFLSHLSHWNGHDEPRLGWLDWAM